jgi:poly-gamma-glutamate synthesis protein (capsule biosynthesis protein)
MTYKIQSNSSGTRSIEISEEHLQTIEHYQGRDIYYSIGNFIFDPLKPINSRAALVKLTITATTARVETLPIVIRNCQPRLAK